MIYIIKCFIDIWYLKLFLGFNIVYYVEKRCKEVIKSYLY